MCCETSTWNPKLGIVHTYSRYCDLNPLEDDKSSICYDTSHCCAIICVIKAELWMTVSFSFCTSIRIVFACFASFDATEDFETRRLNSRKGISVSLCVRMELNINCMPILNTIIQQKGKHRQEYALLFTHYCICSALLIKTVQTVHEKVI